MIGSEIGYIPEAVAAALITETRELSKMLCGLINKISE
ncbi:S23 ribosomal [Pseudomonas syringae pv. aceris]|nr:S23 ribosomal [Pseudomonas syringae pv. aceris]